jgi:hypothetical protein
MIYYNETSTSFSKLLGIIVKKEIIVTKKHPDNNYLNFNIIYTDIFDCILAKKEFIQYYDEHVMGLLNHERRNKEGIHIIFLSIKDHPSNQQLF